MWSRIHLIPLLTAEEDRDLVRRHLADQAREKELLGSTTSPYNSDRYVYSSVSVERGPNTRQICAANLCNHAEPEVEIENCLARGGCFRGCT